MWRQVSDFITESFIQLIRSKRLIHSGTKQVPASQCAYYPPYLPQVVFKITNITFRMDSMHTGTQAETVFMNE